MSRISSITSLILAASLASINAHAETDADGFVRVAPEQVDWKSVNDKGVKMAMVYGDQSKPGLYVVRYTFPVGTMSSPHSHSTDRIIAVIKGTWYTGTDGIWDPTTTVALKPGSYMIHPAGKVHFDGAKNEEAIVQITGIGPVITVSDAPNEESFGSPHKLK